MKKTLLNILLGASLTFGNLNETKAQEVGSKFINNDEDEFSEEVIGVRRDGLNEKKTMYENNKMGITYIYYSDKDNDNFHEYIRVWNCDKFQRLVVEDFYIDKNTGLIDFSFERYFLTTNKWNKYYVGKPFINIAKENSHKNLRQIDKKFYPNLTQQEIYNLGMGERVKKLISASENADALKDMLRQERLRSELLK